MKCFENILLLNIFYWIELTKNMCIFHVSVPLRMTTRADYVLSPLGNLS